MQMQTHKADVSSEDERDSQNDPSTHGDSDSTDQEQRPLRKKGGHQRKKKVGAKRSRASHYTS